MKSIKELATRYGMSDQGLRKFIRQNMSIIDPSGEHIKQVGRRWLFDEDAVRRLDDMRNYAEPVVEVVNETKNETSLQEENRRLMQALLASREEIIRLQGELLRLKDETEKKRGFFETIVAKLFRKVS